MAVESLELRILSGAELEPWLGALAHLRITVFREFPYLYDGDEAYEAEYLKVYQENPESICILLLDGDRPVGMSTGMPLGEEDQSFRGPFIRHGYPMGRIFFFGDSVLLPEYGGNGYGRRFMEERERFARSFGRFEYLTFFAVERTADDSRRPLNYVPLDGFWRRCGFRKHPELNTTFSLKEIGEPSATPKRMIFWLKYL